MRKMILLGMSLAMVLSMSITAFAGTWKQDARGWWYQHDNGSYTTEGWEQINGKYYYFDGMGYMLANTVTPDNCYVGADGAWVQETENDYCNLAKGFKSEFIFPDFYLSWDDTIASIKKGSDYYQIRANSNYGKNVRITRNCIIEGEYGITYSNPEDYFRVLEKENGGHFPDSMWIRSYDSRGYATNVVWKNGGGE